MANRVLVGNRSTGGYGLYVSKANSNVLDCDDKDLLFDSREKASGTGQVYAGGGPLNITSGNRGASWTKKVSGLGPKIWIFVMIQL